MWSLGVMLVVTAIQYSSLSVKKKVSSWSKLLKKYLKLLTISIPVLECDVGGDSHST